MIPSHDEKLKKAPQKEGGNSCVAFLLCDPGRCVHISTERYDSTFRLNGVTTNKIIIVLLVVCVCFLSIHSGHTSSSLDVPAGVTQEEGHTGFLIHLLSAVRALIFLARRIQPFLSLVDREVEFCVLTI